jgi:ADP-ribosylglycohydrolase
LKNFFLIKGIKILIRMINNLKHDQYFGCILGGAIGDALGSPVEFLSSQQIFSLYGAGGVTDFVEYEDGTGEITDDTQMTLFTAEGLLRAFHKAVHNGKDVDYISIVYKAYLRWLYTQDYFLPPLNPDLSDGWLIKQKELYRRRGPGHTCLSALQSRKMGSTTIPINNSKGCGTVMRIAPAGLIFSYDPKSAFKLGVDLSALTHGHPSGYLSGGWLASFIYDLAHGSDLHESMGRASRELLLWPGHEESLQAIEKALNIHESLQNKNLTWKDVENVGEGWVAEEALAIALLCVLHYPGDFEKAVLTSINHSGDSDSTGAITGNICGLIAGASNIPLKWKQNLRNRRILEEIANDLYLQFSGSSFQATDEWAAKYPPY